MSAYSDLILATSGLLGYWRLGEGAGTNVVDAFGSLDGTSVNATLGATGAIFGDADTAYTFNGTTAYATLTNDATLQLTTGSMEFWMKQGVFGGFGGVCLKQFSYNIFSNEDKVILYDFGTDTIRDTLVTVSDNAWHHVVLTFQSGVSDGTLIYVDGALELTTSFTQTSEVSAVSIGAGSPAGDQKRPGSLDEVAIYSGILTAVQVAAHYDMGVNGPSSGYTRIRNQFELRPY
jgi:hypothetical protein